jgi:hypothetical protein
MSKPGKMHFEAERDVGTADIRITPCKRMMGASRVTEDPAEVTCGGCLSWLARRPAPEPEPPPHTITSRPAPPPQAWDDRGTDIVARSRAGDDGPRREGWGSIDGALEAWWNIIGRSLIASSTSFGGAGGGGDGTPAWADRRGRVVWVGVALARACAVGRHFDGDADGDGALDLSPGDCATIVGQYLAGQDDATRIAERLGPRVTANQVGLVWREIKRSVSRDLEGRGLLPRRAENRDTREVKEARMALPAGYDVEGWKEIADELHLSESQARELDRRGELRGIVDSYGGHRVIAKRTSLRAFAASRVRARRTG